MATGTGKRSVFERLDQLNEFERRPVSRNKLHGGMYFAGSFAGEHVAATEFVIGALFVAGGAGVYDVLVGLLVGNLLAVLSWLLICAPIATQTRLTLYWYLRRIAGPGVTFVYNILNAALYCVLAGCMITVSASAVRIPFGIEPQTEWLPTDPWFVAVTAVVGAVVVLLAILGFKRLAQFASVCSPWMFIMFVAGALVVLPRVGHFNDFRGFQRLGRQKIWTGAPPYESMEIVSAGNQWAAAPGILLTFSDNMQLVVKPRPMAEEVDTEGGMFGPMGPMGPMTDQMRRELRAAGGGGPGAAPPGGGPRPERRTRRGQGRPRAAEADRPAGGASTDGPAEEQSPDGDGEGTPASGGAGEPTSPAGVTGANSSEAAETAAREESTSPAKEAASEPAGESRAGESEQSEEGELEPLGFRIAGTGKGERKFIQAQAIIEGNRVFVYCDKITQPAVVSYGEGPHSGNIVLRDRHAASDAQDRQLKPFRSYVARADKVYTFWHIAAFAWICNLAMHLGLSDMALFRFARHWWYGVYSAFGMFLGHYVAWICAGIMGAGVASAVMMDSPLTLLDSGEVAFRALGIMGALAVVIAGWTTSNPTLYRAGLALQVVTPGWPRWLVTLLAGVVTTAVACFPFVFRQLLGFVGLYGLLLMPVGAIVVVEHWIFPLVGLKRYWSARKGQLVNWPALIAWLAALLFALYCWYFDVLHLFFLAAPVWVITAVLYMVLAAFAGAAGKLPELEAETAEGDESSGPSDVPGRGRPSGGRVQLYFWLLALACLLSIVLFSYCIFAGYLAHDAVFFRVRGYKITYFRYLTIATVVYFVAGIIWMNLRERVRAPASSADRNTGPEPTGSAPEQ